MDELWSDDATDVTALLANSDHDEEAVSVDELLSFLDAPLGDAPSPPPPTGTVDDSTSSDPSHSPSRSLSPSPSLTSTSASTAPRKRAGGSSQMKRSLETLRTEVRELAQELHQWQTQSRRSAAMERALAERFKRRRAEHECQQLRDAVLSQQHFVRGLRSVFSTPPSFVSGLNLCHYLHNYTKLPRDPPTRWREYAALAQETRLRNAMDILCRETESLTISDDYDTLSPSLSKPFIQTEMLPDAGGFGVTTTSVYAMETGDIGAVLRGVCIAACDLMPTCPAYPTTNITQKIVDPDAPPAGANAADPRFLYRAMDVSYKSLDDQDALVVASRGVTICKQTDDVAVVVWDFVDDDELHPTAPSADITRQAVGACLIRREVCADGRERTVYRALSTRIYRYHSNASSDALKRYYLDSRRRMRTNELLFRDIMRDAIAKEEAANAAARCRSELVG